MAKDQTYTNNLLTIQVEEQDDQIEVKWTGKSTDREPAKFISPILIQVLKAASTLNKRIIMDFQQLQYMNSSTITPLIKILDRAKKGTNKITIFYHKATKWQELNFTALEIFQTDDNRLEIKGL
ncbi:MAG: SiaC family regulatory phosphoprotein [Desulfobacterales bacterium]|nr:SiaC family regulatory phosphoprotein [Desulfobacterales bacterium]MDJ0874587.1 SiaC family regulatory phosphoprotein [Desulfobacterales bacterium]MDJ0882993.1 SiaC family regulatory phosphoprotein [Desulfobacterales bacterium]